MTTNNISPELARELTPLGPPNATFLTDPVSDSLVSVTMELAAETWVLRQRIRALEAVLEEANLIRPRALDDRVDRDSDPQDASERDAFVQRVFGAFADLPEHQEP